MDQQELSLKVAGGGPRLGHYYSLFLLLKIVAGAIIIISQFNARK